MVVVRGHSYLAVCRGPDSDPGHRVRSPSGVRAGILLRRLRTHSAVPSAGEAALVERGGTGRLPVSAVAPPLAAGRPLTDRQARWFGLESSLLEFSWRCLHQAHPQRLSGLEGAGPLKR